MKILISVLISIFLSAPSFAATLTAGCTPVVAQGGTTPQIQCASIYDTGNTNATGDVGIAQVVPAYGLDINGTIGNSNGDLDSNPWQDYSGTSTIVGWGSYASKFIYTKKIGKTVFVSYAINGTSNSTSTHFTVPYNMNTTTGILGTSAQNYDNGGAQTGPGYIYGSANNEVSLYKDMAGTGWTSSGQKVTEGEFWYQSDT